MKKFLVAALALALTVGSLSAKNPGPEKTVYIIDGKRVEQFDGSQLKGKTITSYEIGSDDVHVIFTTDYNTGTSEPLKVVSATTLRKELGTVGDARKITITGSVTRTETDGTGQRSMTAEVYKHDETVYVVDGKVVDGSEFAAMNLKKIKEIQVIKSKDHPIYKKYVTDDTKKTGVIYVTLK